MGDPAYSYNKFTHNFSKRDNVAVITRIRVNKVIYKKYEDKKKALEEENMVEIFAK